MKKLIATIGSIVLMFGGIAFADNASAVAPVAPANMTINLGPVSFHVPCQDFSVVGLLDTNHLSAALLGCETTCGSLGKIATLSIGGIISHEGAGTPYGSINYVFASPQSQGLLSKLGFQAFDFGFFAGYDFSLRNSDFYSNCRFGFKVATQVLSLFSKN